tara:strand:+ start:525 stop:626 length:102 start_codon:yes stop_codon:yes gene_type:complete
MSVLLVEVDLKIVNGLEPGWTPVLDDDVNAMVK